MMMRYSQRILPFAFMFGLCGWLQGQSASGILAPSRSVDWTTAGVVGGIPTRTTVCSTFNPGATASQINTAIANCPSGQVVMLNAGTYNLSSGINISGKRDFVLRGAGPDQTFLKFTGTTGCGGWGADICVDNGDGSDARDGAPNQATWTAGYGVGTTTVTIGSVSSGSINNLQVGSILWLDRLDDGNTDTGQVWVCGNGTTCSEAGYLNGRNGRGQTEPQTVVSKSGTGPWTIGISPGIRMGNEGANSPGAYWFNGLPANVGIENLSIDISSTVVGGGIFMHHASNAWVKNIRSLNASNKHIWIYECSHVTIRDSYFYGTQNAASESYGTDPLNSADILVENNIFHHIATPMMDEGCLGCVYGYNYAIDDYYTADTQWQQGSSYHHAIGNAYILWEGNIGIGMTADDVHGTSNFFTAFRNYWNGRDPAGGSSGGKTEQTSPVILNAYNRYYNFVGNVLGTPGYHTNYQVAPTTKTDSNGTANADNSIYVLGYSGNEGSFAVFNNDLVLLPSMMRWGNYDTVNNTVRWLATEVPSGLSLYANPVPASQILPASFYQAAKPSWFGSVAWPAIGPDVTGGAIAGLGGHANKVPAQLCYESSPKVSGILTFNANNCYATSGGGSGPPNPPTNVQTALDKTAQ